MNELQARAATADDVILIQQLATEIWLDYYPAIISVAQIEYMLETLYSVERLTLDIEQYKLTLFELQSQTIGFMGCIIQQQNLFLNQLYLKTAFHSRGLGQKMLQHAEQLALQQHLPSISLRVNKNNHKAITAYERAGFHKTGTDCKNIGQGFVMDDYIMRKVLLLNNELLM